jgi:oxygen-independent coproporphyrinogen-3 oxidase
MIREMELRKDYLQSEPLSSIYFGGGTPSLLSAKQLDSLFNSIHKHFIVADHAEITLEANPDDLTPEKNAELKTSPLNRLSIGIQSFFADDLQWMHRAHTAQQAEGAVQLAKAAGFENLTIDLIYGMPMLTDEKWIANLEKALSLGIDHISSYALTVEPKTALDHFIRSHKSPAVNEEQSAQQFGILVDTLEHNGFEQYEISNFARHQKYAVHNTSYWKNQCYLGIGPSAHSFNKTSRSWNIANNAAYVKAIARNEPAAETELLTTENRFNEYLMTGLRTMWGCDTGYIETTFGKSFSQKLLGQLEQKQAEGLIRLDGPAFILTKKGKLFADGIAAELFR